MVGMFRRTRRWAGGERGFTLIELVVVIAIIGLLVAIVVPRVSDALDQGRKTSGWASAKGLYSALERYYFDHDKYPGTEDLEVTKYTDFVALVEDYADLAKTEGQSPFKLTSYELTDDDDYDLHIESKDRSHTAFLITPDGVEEE